ncbi:MAG: hypothetical protein R3F62_18535 [Planctomycetota bacterium]
MSLRPAALAFVLLLPSWACAGPPDAAALARKACEAASELPTRSQGLLEGLQQASPYELRLIRPAVPAGKWITPLDDAFTVEVWKGGARRYAWKAHAGSSFTIAEGVLYRSEYCAIASGCTVRAIDLATGAERWSTGLQGIGPVAHSKYFNSVRLYLEEGLLCVAGYEAAGSYGEVLDPASGRTLANHCPRRE